MNIFSLDTVSFFLQTWLAIEHCCLYYEILIYAKILRECLTPNLEDMSLKTLCGQVPGTLIGDPWGTVFYIGDPNVITQQTVCLAVLWQQTQLGTSLADSIGLRHCR
jgi:hypothetical protein